MINYEKWSGPDEYGSLQETGGEEKKFLVFHIGSGSFGLEVPYVMEIIWDIPVTPIPGVPAYFDGVCSWKGNIIPVVSLGSREAGSDRKTAQGSVIVVVRAAGYECGLTVTETPKIVGFAEEKALSGEIPKVMEGIVRVRGAYAGEAGLIYVIDEAELLKSLVVYA